VAESCVVLVVAAKVAIIGRSGAEENIRAQVVSSGDAEFASMARYARLDGNSIACLIKKNSAY